MNNSFRIKTTYWLAIFFVALIFTFSCNDDYDRHYAIDESLVSEYSLMELIAMQPELTVFAAMLHQTGYDSVLSKDQVFTVFAPTNEALAGINRNDEKEALNTVRTHIVRYLKSASGDSCLTLFTLNAKMFLFEKIGNTFYIGGKKIVEKNKTAKNGILHILEERMPFKMNVWEYMSLPNLDSIRNYLYSFDKRLFQPSLSKIIDYDGKTGLPIYDSIFVESNELWNTYRGARGIGYLSNEDSLYTMILPTNTAWTSAYQARKPYFVSNILTDPDSAQETNTCYAIVQDLVFRGRIESPQLYGATDSLISTRGGIFHEPSYLFEGASKEEASNGLVYLTDQLPHKPSESWRRPILIEAERVYGREIGDGMPRYVYNPDISYISDHAYLTVEPNGTSSRPRASFEIPNVTAGKYNIYCVFLPATVNPNLMELEQTRIRCGVEQMDRKSGEWMSIQSGGAQGGEKIPDHNTTHPTEITKMLLFENFQFPYANVNEDLNIYRVYVLSRVTATETTQGYRNRMFIDYILLEPAP